MATEALKTMRGQLVSCVQGQMGDISKVDTHELGEAIDMIKDLSESIYYCTITEAMEKADKKEEQQPSVNNVNYYTTPATNYNRMYTDPWREAQRAGGYMYYTPGSNGGGMSGNQGTSYYTPQMPYQMPYDMQRDPREGRAAVRRRMYMEGKQKHNDTNSQLKELQAYLQELSTDITEMIKDSSQEERAVLRQKMTNLANKIT